MLTDRQRLFNTSLEHIRRQGKPAIGKQRKPINADGAELVCLYRSPEGLSCGAAPFIIEYDAAMETLSWEKVVAAFPSKVEPTAAENARFVAELQAAHDGSYTLTENSPKDYMYEYEKAMQGVADTFGLSYTKPEV